jgi:hypothetical protein
MSTLRLTNAQATRIQEALDRAASKRQRSDMSVGGYKMALEDLVEDVIGIAAPAPAEAMAYQPGARNLTEHQKAVEEAAGMPLDWNMANAATVVSAAQGQPDEDAPALKETLVQWLMYALRQYRELFGEECHGTERQCRALAELHNDMWAAAPAPRLTEDEVREALDTAIKRTMKAEEAPNATVRHYIGQVQFRIMTDELNARLLAPRTAKPSGDVTPQGGGMTSGCLPADNEQPMGNTQEKCHSRSKTATSPPAPRTAKPGAR